MDIPFPSFLRRLGLLASALLLSGTLLTAGASGQSTAAQDQKEKTDDPSGMTVDRPPKEGAPLSLRLAWQNLQKLNSGRTLTGPAVFGIARDEQIQFFSAPLPRPDLGYYRADNHAVIVTSDTSWGEALADLQFCTLTHELTHAAQDKNGLFRKYNIDGTRSLLDNQRMFLSNEAAAKTLSFVAAFERMRQDDDSGPWEECRHEDSLMAEILERTFDRGIDSGLTYRAALEQAGTACFYQVFNNQLWLDHYNRDFFSAFALALFNDRLKNISDTLTVAELKKSGALGDAFNGTAFADSLPSRASLCGANWTFAAAGDYLEWQRVAAVFGAKDPRAEGLYRRLKDSDNPYADVSILAVFQDMAANPDPNHGFLEALHAVAVRFWDKTSPPPPAPLTETPDLD